MCETTHQLSCCLCVREQQQNSLSSTYRNVQSQVGPRGIGSGLAYVFLQSAYASAGITSLRGQGFVLAHVNGKWSAPAYIAVTKLGAGLSIGETQPLSRDKKHS